MKAKRDWLTLKFSLNHFEGIGTWRCIDGYSDYELGDFHNLTSFGPNRVDISQDC